MDSWLRSLHDQPHDLPDDLFNPAYRQLIRRILATSQTRVAYDPALPEDRQLLGYSVTWPQTPDQPEVLHWLYTKDPHRRQGIGLLLISHLAPKPLHTFRTRATRTYFSPHLGPCRPALLLRLRQPQP